MPNRWVTGALILTVLSLLGSAIVISQVAQGGGGSGNEISATCPSMQYATGENKSGNFLCGSASNTNYLTSALTTQTAVSTEAAATCPVRQYATGENSDGSFVCGSASNTNYLTTQTSAFFNYGSCTSNQYVTAITTTTVNCGQVPIPFSYIINQSGTTITAYPNMVGLTQYSGTECGTVINNAVNAVINQAVGITGIFIKSADYHCATTINAKQLRLIGENYQSTILDFNTTLTTAVTSSSYLDSLQIVGTSNIKILFNSNISNSIITNSFFRGANVVTGSGIVINAQNVRLSNDRFSSMKNGISIVSNRTQISNIGFTSVVNNLINDSSNGSNQFSNIGGTILLNSGVKLDSISNCVSTYCTVTDNSGQTNYACPPISGLICQSVSTEAIASCGAGLFATSESNDGSFSCNSPNITFQNNTKSCADTTSGTVLMAGFKLNYTTVGTGKVTVNINFQIASPATSGINTKFRIAFGTGNAPACNAAVTGTKVGNQYEVGTFAATASFETIDLSVGVITLSAATTYWFDIQMQDSTAASWTYSNPQMTIMES